MEVNVDTSAMTTCFTVPLPICARLCEFGGFLLMNILTMIVPGSLGLACNIMEIIGMGCSMRVWEDL